MSLLFQSCGKTVFRCFAHLFLKKMKPAETVDTQSGAVAVRFTAGILRGMSKGCAIRVFSFNGVRHREHFVNKYLDGKVRCMYVYPARYSNRGAYVYLSESGRAAFIKYDQGSVRYYVVDDTLLRFMTVMDDLSVCWDLPEWEPHGGNPWTQLDNPYIPLIKPEGYESTYEFQSVIAASWINTIRSLQEQFDSVAEQ